MDSAEEATKWCNNCRSNIPSTSFTLHDAHCARKIRYCQQCEIGVTLVTWDEHVEEYHTKIPCQKCKKDIVKAKEEEHVAKECGYRSITCDHCELDLFAKDLAEHELYCKTRTEYCDRCRNYINVRELDTHNCVPYEDTRAARSTESGFNGDTGSSSGVDVDHVNGIGNMADLETRLLFDLQLQEFQREREREALANIDGPARSPPWRQTTSESSSFNETVLETDCPNCGRKVLITDVHNHLIECTENRNEVVNGDSPFGVGDDVPPAATDDDFDGEIVCEICGMAVDVEMYNSHFQTCPNYFDDPFGYYRTEMGGSGNTNSAADKNDDSSLRRPNRETSGVEAKNTVPCEFCYQNIDFEKYQDHLSVCPGEESRGAGATGGFGLHANGFNNNDNFQYHRATALNGAHVDTNSAEEEFLLPCEFCSKLFAPDLFHDHQMACRLDNLTNFSTESVSPTLAHNSFESSPGSPAVSGNSLIPGVPLDFMDKPLHEQNRTLVQKAVKSDARIEGSRDSSMSTKMSANYSVNRRENYRQGRSEVDYDGKRSNFHNSPAYERKASNPNYESNLRPLPKRLSGYQDFSTGHYNPRINAENQPENGGTISNVNKKFHNPTHAIRSSNVDEVVNDTLSSGGTSRRSVFERLGEPNMVPNGNSRNMRGTPGGNYRLPGHTLSNGANRTGPYRSPVGSSNAMQPSAHRSPKPSATANANNDRTNNRRANGKL